MTERKKLILPVERTGGEGDNPDAVIKFDDGTVAAEGFEDDLVVATKEGIVPIPKQRRRVRLPSGISATELSLRAAKAAGNK